MSAASPRAFADFASLQDPKIRVFQIESIDRQIRCSATLLPSTDDTGKPQCRLVTNAHCVPNLRSRFVLSAPTGVISPAVQEFFGKLQRPETVSVRRVQTSADLAELTVPTALQTRDCAFANLNDDLRIDERAVQSLGANSSSHGAKTAYYATLGFHGGRPVVHFAEDGDWGLGNFAPSILYRARTSLPALQSVYNLRNVPLFNGMSGGPTIDSDGNVVGINVRLVQMQDQSFVITLDDVLRFLEAKIGDSTLAVSAVENGREEAGENVGGHAGENVGGHAGENVGGHAGDKKKVAPKKRTPLSFFREPDEGVEVKVNGQSLHLLGIGPHQIDGFDDLRAAETQPGVRFYRESPEFKAVQQSVLKRFAGDYRPAEAVVPDVQLVWDPVSATWSPLRKGRAAAWIVVNPVGGRRAQIRLSYVNSADSGINAIYEAAMSSSGTVISLKSADNGNVLQCENSHYLKLICTSDTEEFSLSLQEVGAAEISFRSARIQPDGSVRYVYGRLQRSSK